MGINVGKIRKKEKNTKKQQKNAETFLTKSKLAFLCLITGAVN